MTNVLVISDDGFGSLSGGGVLKRNLFLDYDKNNLLSLDCCDDKTLESDVSRVSLNPYILKYSGISLVDWLKSRLFSRGESIKNNGKSSINYILKFLIGDASRPSYPVRLGKLKKEIECFAPEVIYTTMGLYATNRITLYLAKEFNIPIVVHVMDDWINAKNNYGILSFLQRSLIGATFNDIIRIASVRYAISPGMKVEYERRYGYEFSVLHNTVESNRIKKGVIRSRSNLISIGYVGSFSENSQRSAIDEVLKAIEILNNKQHYFNVVLSLFVTPYNFSYTKSCYENNKSIGIYHAPRDDDDFFDLISSFDVLLLPSSFDGVANSYIRFSIPAKLYSYLASGIPVLFYGDKNSEQIKLAIKHQLGIIVDEISNIKIVEALEKLYFNESEITSLLSRQHDFLLKYCDASMDRHKFYQRIKNCWKDNFICSELSYDDNLIGKKRFYLKQIIEKYRPKTIIDFGCGTGTTLSSFLYDKYPEIKLTLFDVDTASLDAATWAHDDVEKKSDFTEINDNSYDLIIISEVVEHIPQDNEVLKDLFRLLHDDGVLFITVPNGYGLYESTNFIWRTIKFFIPFQNISNSMNAGTLSNSPHIDFYTFSRLINNLNSTGFLVSKYFSVMGFHFMPVRYLCDISLFVSKINFLGTRSPNIADDWGIIAVKSKYPSNYVPFKKKSDNLFNYIRRKLYTKKL